MIERISGKLIRNSATFAVLDCSGVGYGIQISARSGAQLPPEGQNATLLTYLHVREDALQLYGFCQEQERDLFMAMIDVSGIGPKMAQRILSEVSPTDFLTLIAQENHVGLSKIKGIGKKTAELLVLALKDKAAQLSLTAGSTPIIQGAAHEALLALHSLGVKDPIARKAIEKAQSILGPQATLTQLIPEALRHT